MRKSIWIAALLLAGCGGGGGNGGNGGDDSALLFADYADAQNGGYRSTRLEITDAANPVQETDCGYIDVPTLSEAEDAVDDAGGKITTARDDRWCTNNPGETFCLLRAGGSLITDHLYTGDVSAHDYELIIPSLNGGKRAYFSVFSDNTGTAASADIETTDNSIGSSGNCTPSNNPAETGDLNGSWKGWRLTYSAGNKTGSETTATMSCSAQSCTIAGESFGALSFTGFDQGSWIADQPNRVAGASISADRLSLAVYVCSAPLDEAQIVRDCKFYGFNFDS